MMKRIFLLIIIVALLSASNRISAGEEQSEQLLNTAGMSEAWLTSTKNIRDHLSKLNLADPAVVKFMPAIKRRCATLLKLPKIGTWERAIFADMFEAMLEDLVNGKKVLSRYAGQTVNYGYWSEHINRLTGTKIQIPPDYNSDKEYQFFMYYKIGGGWN